jgi:DNA-binding NarL/FixJ family response regulator
MIFILHCQTFPISIQFFMKDCTNTTGCRESDKRFDRYSTRLLSEQVWAIARIRLKLTDRETEIARYVLEDLKELAIGQRLGISTHTVHTHIERMYRKLSVSSRMQLAMHILKIQHEIILDAQRAD